MKAEIKNLEAIRQAEPAYTFLKGGRSDMATRINTEKSKPPTMQKRIGSIVYEVAIHFDPDAKETFNDKILRLIRCDLEASS